MTLATTEDVICLFEEQASLAALGVDDDILVLHSTDQSNPFGQHGLWGHPYLTIASYIRDCTFRVPLIFRRPWSTPVGGSSVSLRTTTGSPRSWTEPGSRTCPSRTAPAVASRRCLMAACPRSGRMPPSSNMRNEESRTIRTPAHLCAKRMPGVGADELYDLVADPAQDHDVSTESNPEARTPEDVLVIRLDAPLIFANADAFHTRIRKLVQAAEPPPRAVVLDLETLSCVDTDGSDVLRVIHDELAEKGIVLAISRLNKEGREALRANHVYERIGAERFFPRVEDAVDAVSAGSRRRNDSPGSRE